MAFDDRSRIRWGRVLLGGVAGAVVCIASGLLIGVVLLDGAVQPPFDTLWEETPPAGPAQALAAVLSLLMRAGFGFLVAWVYAAICPRFGAGPKTAVIAGLFVWVSTRVYAGALVWGVGVYSGATTALALVWALVEMTVVGLVVGWLYREAPSDA